MKRLLEGIKYPRPLSFVALAIVGVLTAAVYGCNENVELTGAPEEEETIPPVETQDSDTIAQIIRGGALYSNWMDEAEKPVPDAPATDSATGMYILMLDHADLTGVPGLTDANRFNGKAETTYRCKTCHGWDYKGVDGVYGDPSSDNYTGFIGILDAAKKYTVEELEAIIGDGVPHPNNPTLFAHAFGAWLDDPDDITALALFVKYGLVDTDEYLWKFSGWVKSDKGDPGRGQELYEGAALCTNCHGSDGLEIDFKDDNPGVGEDEFVGTIGIENPWEMLHTIRFGYAGSESPRSEMPALYKNPDLTTQDAVDIMAYTQTLPIELP